MRRYRAMIRAICLHKYWTLYYCVRLGIPWLGITHDMSKFSPLEFRRYAINFFKLDGSKVIADGDGGYDPSEQSEWWMRAWLHHQRNRHHWHAWVAIGHKGTLTPLNIPEKYCREMVADWMAAHKLEGGDNIWQWYCAHADNFLLHPRSRRRIEELLKIVAGLELR